MKSKFIPWFGVVLILEIGLLHLMTAQKEYEEAAYMGYLFAANFFGSLVAAFGIYHGQRWGWLLGVVIAAGSIAGYAWSRTLGMPGMEVEEWFIPYGIVAMTLEAIFVLLLFFRPWALPNEDVSSPGYQFNRGQIIAGLALLVVTSLSTYEWNEAVIRAYGRHIVSLEQVLESPELSLAELEDEYGVQISLAATSMLNGIVDVRLKILDPDKAHLLLQSQAALLVNGEELILAPHMHSHIGSRLKAGKIYFMFFPTSQLITAGSEVSLVFGLVRIEPVTVR